MLIINSFHACNMQRSKNYNIDFRIFTEKHADLFAVIV